MASKKVIEREGNIMIYKLIEKTCLTLMKILILATFTIAVFSTAVYKINQQAHVLIIDENGQQITYTSQMDALDDFLSGD